ncbi:MAG: acyl--CoA ligase [Desulfurococcales archaeon]|nr:acyl--CoA ligase [Desulfurococcales archaeon]
MKPWLSVWPEGVPQSIEYPEEPAYAPFLESARGHPGRCAVAQAETGSCLEYSKLEALAKRVASWLQGRGAGPGVQVLYSAFNTPEAVAGLLGVWMSGAQAVLVDPLTTSEDLRFQLEGRGIRLAVVSPEFYERERATLAASGVEEALVLTGYYEGRGGGPGASDLGGLAGLEREWREPALRPGEDVSTVMYYSGIAGRTMQTLHTHMGPLASTIAYTAMLQLGEPPVSLVVAPLTHVLGLQAGILPALYYGGTAVLMRRWRPRAALAAMAAWGVNYLSGAPMMHESLLAEARAWRPEGLRLSIGVSGGAPLKPEVQREYREVLGAPLVQLYGMTETWVVTFQPRHLADVEATVGIPLPDVDAKIVDPEDPHSERGVGEVGELLVRAPWVMKGYEDPEETRRAFADGWVRTGDLMVMDERGLLYFRGVRKRMIKYKAYPIFPRDLEIILERHPAVEKAYVYGEPHPEHGQIPVARVRLRPEYRGRVTPEDLMEYVNSRVAFYKKIRRVEVVEGDPASTP